MTSFSNRLSFCSAALILAFTISIAQAQAGEVLHALTGVVSKVDAATKTLSVKTADGAEHAFKYTEKTTVHDATVAGHEVKQASVDSYLASKKGSQVVVRYTENGSDHVATSVTDFGKDSLRSAKGAVDHGDKDAHTLTIKTEDGGEKTFNLSKHAVVETDHGAVDAAKWSYKEGDKVTVHYASAAGKNIAHFIHKF